MGCLQAGAVMQMSGQDVHHSWQGEVDGEGVKPCGSDGAAAEFSSTHSSGGGIVLPHWWVRGEGTR